MNHLYTERWYDRRGCLELGLPSGILWSHTASTSGPHHPLPVPILHDILLPAIHFDPRWANGCTSRRQLWAPFFFFFFWSRPLTAVLALMEALFEQYNKGCFFSFLSLFLEIAPCLCKGCVWHCSAAPFTWMLMSCNSRQMWSCIRKK